MEFSICILYDPSVICIFLPLLWILMINIDSIYMQTIEQEDRTLEDFQDVKDVIKKRYRMDNALEDKICDLYDLYIEVKAFFLQRL